MCGDKGSGCQKAKDVNTRPGDCSPEQIEECHGDAQRHPCVATEGCEHPEKLKERKPGDCSAEQVRKCHGSAAEHHCV